VIGWIIGIIIFTILLGILFRIVKGVLRTIITALMLLFLIFSVLVIFAFIDAKQFSEKFPKSSNGFIYFDKEPKAIFIMENNNVTIPGNVETMEYFKKYDEGRLNNFYKLFVVKKEAFSDVSFINFDKENITKEFAFQVIEGRAVMQNEFDDNAKTKNMMFALLFKSANEKDFFFLLKEYKKGNIKVIPRTSLFRLVGVIPESWIEKIIKVAPNE